MSLARPIVTSDERAAARRALIALRQQSLPAQRAAADESINARLAKLLGTSGLVASDARLAGYWPIRGEPDIRPFLSHWREAGGMIMLPVVVAADTALCFVRWAPGEPVRAGAHGTIEPACGETLDPDIVLVPCVGFTLDGQRLGYGGGYYDRTLAQIDVPVIGIAYEATEISGLRAQPHDIRLDFIVTERRLIDCADRGGDGSAHAG